MICKRVLYSGRVQGVGFRYTVCTIADGRPITGFVRNLANGDVELVAEGLADDLQPFLDAVAQRMAENIREQRVEQIEPEGFQEFKVRY